MDHQAIDPACDRKWCRCAIAFDRDARSVRILLVQKDRPRLRSKASNAPSLVESLPGLHASLRLPNVPALTCGRYQERDDTEGWPPAPAREAATATGRFSAHVKPAMNLLCASSRAAAVQEVPDEAVA